ncbi:MAG: stage II sporulation protein M [Desulfurococcaceae archaeon]
MDNEVFQETSSKLYMLVKNIVFKKEPIIPYMLPGFFLSISLFSLIIIITMVFITVLEGKDLNGIMNQVLSYGRFAQLYIGYVLLSAVFSYRYSSLITKHLIDSGITSYYWLRESNDYESIKTLYFTGLFRRNIPSPITVLVLTIVTFGFAYPFILYVLEKNLRNHASGEEKKFLNKSITNEIDVSNLLLDIVLTIITLGLYMILLSSRPIRVYNRHISIVHSSHPHRPLSFSDTDYRELTVLLPKSSIFQIAIVFLTTSLISILHFIRISVYIIAPFVFGIFIYMASLTNSEKSFAKQVLYTLLATYLVFTLSTIIGFTGFDMYYNLLKSFQSQTESLVKDFNQILVYIYVNNLTISLLSLIPYFGSIFIGSGLSNAGLIYGVFLADSILIRNNYTPLILFILPHSLLELLSYSLFISLSTRLFKTSNVSIVSKLLISMILLFIAALVETLTIGISR